MDSVKREWAELMEAADPAVYHTVVGAGLSHSESMQAYLTFMAPRLVEMRRVLAATGGIYLHCDPTASHYLKQLMDCIFGRSEFKNEITWQRNSGRSKGWHSARSFSNDADILLYYGRSPSHRFNGAYLPLTEDETRAKFPMEDERGRYNTGTPLFNQPSMGARPNQCYTYKGVTNPHPSGWRVVRERLEKMDSRGDIIWRDGKRPLRKSYADDYRGKPYGNVWVDVSSAAGNERTGWPTQKPLALLRRIIEASSNPSALVLDPFAGCGTACVAAEQLGRRWAGIDIDSKAEEVTRDRLSREAGEGTLFAHPVAVSSNPPRRTDPEQPVRTSNSVLRALLWTHLDVDPADAERRVCPPCGRAKYADDFELDHKQPKSKGGPDIDENLWLICGACNSKKGARSVKHLYDRLAVESAKLPMPA